MLLNSGRGYYRGNIFISWKYPRSVDIIRFPWMLSAFCENIHVTLILSAFCVYICILWILSAFSGNIHVPWILYAFCSFYLSHFTHIVKLTGAMG